MSNSPLVDYTKLAPHREPRTSAIDTITIHCTAGQCDVEPLGEMWFTKIASSNYGIGRDGRVGLYVPENERSYCSSSYSNDHRAITIEVASDMYEPCTVKPVVYAKLIDLLVDICTRNNIPKLLWKSDRSLIGQIDKQNMTVHRWFISTKSCPGEWLYSRMGQIAEDVNKRLTATIYRVQVGAFREKENAEQYLEEVQKHYPNAFITTE